MQIDHVINHMFLANQKQNSDNNVMLICILNVYLQIFIQKIILNNPQCICKIQPYKWLAIRLMYHLLLYFELEKVVEVIYNCMFRFYQNHFVL